MIPLGFTLQPDQEFLERLVAPIERLVDYYEIAPETTWREDGAGRLHPNGFHRRFAALAAAQGKALVAHGVGFSMGTGAAANRRRQQRWLARLAEDQDVFRFRWYTDHLGVSAPDGQAMQLPLPLPMTAHAAALVRGRLAAMQRVVQHVGVENSVFYFVLGDPLAEPAFLARILHGRDLHLLLDLHNVYTMASNFGFDPEAYLSRLDLGRVIELHLSGGADADPAWSPAGRRLRVDSHDRPVPEPVWELLARTVPRCPNLRGVTLERMEGTVGAADVPLIVEELRRARAQLERRA
jgi:uncharacterized protein (UPF0276 family)